MTTKPLWKEEPDQHDYPAAASYLSLVSEKAVVARLVRRMRKAPVSNFKAKDLLRSSRLPMLPPDNVHVAGDLAKIHRGTALSPVLVVRGSLARNVPLTIADGYHRVCASYHVDEDADIPCRIVSR